MSTDYSSQKVPDLQDLLKQRGLPHTGKKADLIARLQESDSAKTTETTEPEPEPEPEPKAAKLAPITAEKSAQEQDNSSGTEQPAEAPIEATENTENTNGEDATADFPKQDFSANLATVTLEEEQEKRRKRAERFGTGAKSLDEPKGDNLEQNQENVKQDESQKLLERQKRFGGVKTGGDAGGIDSLNQALPERQRKREREGGASNERDGKRRDSRKRDGRGKNKNGTQPQNNKDTVPVKKPGSEQIEKDRIAAEKRKARFATSATAS